MSEVRKLSAIMFSDIVGYSAMMGDDEKATVALVDEHKGLLLPIIAEHRGTVLKHIGDAILSSFDSASDAVRCAMAIQEAVAARNAILADGKLPFQLRIGVHVGDVVQKDGDIFGDGVNIAARVQPQAEPGGVCVSQTVYDLCKAQSGLKFKALGKRSLKNIKEKVAIYKVALAAPASGPRRGQAPGAGRSLALAAALAGVLAGAFLGYRRFEATRAQTAAEYVDADPAEPLKQFAIMVLPFAGTDDDSGKEGAVMEALVAKSLTDELGAEGDVRIISGSKAVHTRDEAVDAGRKAGASLVIWGEVLNLRGQIEIQPYLTSVLSPKDAAMTALDANLSEGDQLKLRKTKAAEIGSLSLVAAVRYFAERDPRRALQVLDKISPPTAESELAKGYIAYKQQRLDDAQAEFERAVRDFPDYAAAYNALGNLHRARSSYDEAERCYKKAIALKPLHPASHYNLGSIYAIRGELDKAAFELKNVIGRAPDYAPAHTFLGEVYERQGNLNEAAEQYREGFAKAEGTQYSVLNGLLYYLALAQSGKTRDADQFLREYVEERGPVRIAHAWPLPVARYLAGELDEGKLLSALDAPAITPRMRCAAYYYVGMAHLLKGDRDAARKHFQAVLATNVKYFFEYRQAKAKLDELRS